MALKSYSSVAGTLTKVRAEQIKSEDSLGTLSGDLAALRGQVADIIGAADYKEDVSAAKVQILDLAGHLDAATSASELEVLHDMKIDGAAHVVGAFTADAAALIKGAAEIVGAVKMDSSLAVTGSAEIKGAFTADADALIKGATEMVGNVKMDGTMSLTGSAEMKSTLSVAGLATMNNGLAVNAAAADFNAGVTANEIKIDGDVSDRLYVVGASGEIMDVAGLIYNGTKLAVTGVISGSGALQGASVAVDGAATIQGALAVSGNSTLGGTLGVTGAATFSSSLTVTGDLTVNGTTTTVNSTTVSVDDKNIELGSVASPTDTTAEGGGITLKGATDKTIIWTAADGWSFSENIKVNGNAVVTGDLSAVKGVFSGDVSGVKGTFSGDLAAAKGTFSGALSAPSAKITTLSSAPIAVDASGSLLEMDFKDWVAGTPNQVLVASGGLDGHGVVLSLPQNINSTAAPTFNALTLNNPLANQIVMLDGAKQTVSANLTAFVAGKQYETVVASTGSNGGVQVSLAFPIKDAGNTSLTGALSGKVSIFDALNTLAAASAASAKKSVTVASASLAGSAVVVNAVSGFTADKLTLDNSMVYFNGQLVRSGAVADLSGTVTADYSLDGGYSSMKFSFDVEAGDVIVIQKI